MINGLLVGIAKFLNRVLPYHLAFMLREKNFDQQSLSVNYTVYKEKDQPWAIVMQGPIVLINNFTFETLKLYKYIYPSIQLILSTWEGEDENELGKIRELGVDIIENSKPLFKGQQNINLQIVSAKNGIKQARDKGALYVLKTRTDIRLGKSIDFLYFLLFRSKQFPEQRDKRLRSRLIVFNINMFFVRLYTFTDLTMFGHIDDMIAYWDVVTDTSTESEASSFEEMYKLKLGEFYYVDLFLKKMGFEMVNSKEGYEQALIQFFGVADIEEADLFWYKYRYYMEGKSRYENLNAFTGKHVTWNYGKWLALFKNNDLIFNLKEKTDTEL